MYLRNSHDTNAKESIEFKELEGHVSYIFVLWDGDDGDKRLQSWFY